MATYHVTVSGRVQGVWYRQSCRRRAEQAGVTGWVRNNPDGTVEAVIEGDQPAVDDVMAWMRSGPSNASVTSFDAQPVPPTGTTSFEVR